MKETDRKISKKKSLVKKNKFERRKEREVKCTEDKKTKNLILLVVNFEKNN